MIVQTTSSTAIGFGRSDLSYLSQQDTQPSNRHVQRYWIDDSPWKVRLNTRRASVSWNTDVSCFFFLIFTSGTNGYVQRNLSVLRTHETAAERAAAWDIAPPKHREPDEAILEHERKRKVEVKCLELQLKLEDDEYV